MLDLSKLKAFADDTFEIIKMMISVFDKVENSVGKGENAGYQHFLLFPQCFPKPSSLGLLKIEIVWQRFNILNVDYPFCFKPISFCFKLSQTGFDKTDVL